jgi:serine/threonine protein kinase
MKKSSLYRKKRKDKGCQTEEVSWKAQDSDLKKPEFSSRFLSDYEPGQVLGSGSFGVVFKARHKLVEIDYAVKCISLGESREKVMREVKSHASLSHQHIVRYYVTWLEDPTAEVLQIMNNSLEDETDLSQIDEEDAETSGSECQSYVEASREESSGGIEFNVNAATDPHYVRSHKEEPKEFLFIAMELCSGGTLRKWLENVEPRRSDIATKLFHQICSGVAYIHKQKLIHRDLKPENIYLSHSSCIKIGDFGLATHTWQSKRGLAMKDSKAKELTHYVGTDMYMAPEVKSGKQYTCKADIYSLGVILLEFLVPMKTRQEFDARLSDAKKAQYPSSVDSQWTNLVTQMLHDDPNSRPDANQILRASPKQPKPPSTRYVHCKTNVKALPYVQ